MFSIKITIVFMLLPSLIFFRMYSKEKRFLTATSTTAVNVIKSIFCSRRLARPKGSSRSKGETLVSYEMSCDVPDGHCRKTTRILCTLLLFIHKNAPPEGVRDSRPGEEDRWGKRGGIKYVCRVTFHCDLIVCRVFFFTIWCIILWLVAVMSCVL